MFYNLKMDLYNLFCVCFGIVLAIVWFLKSEKKTFIR